MKKKKLNFSLDTFALFFAAFVPMMYVMIFPVTERSLTACIALTSLLLAGAAWMGIQEIKSEESEKEHEEEDI